MNVTKKWLADPANINTRQSVGDFVLRNRMVLADGFTMSVQYSSLHYTNARWLRTGQAPLMGGDGLPLTTPLPEPTSVELGFPTGVEPSLKPYAEDWSDPTGTVYAQVPLAVVDAIIAKHGGLKDPAEAVASGDEADDMIDDQSAADIVAEQTAFYDKEDRDEHQS